MQFRALQNAAAAVTVAAAMFEFETFLFDRRLISRVHRGLRRLCQLLYDPIAVKILVGIFGIFGTFGIFGNFGIFIFSIKN